VLLLQKKIDRPFEFLIEDLFNVTGVGLVVSGFANAGEWRKGDPMYIGPMRDGSFVKTVARSAHVAQSTVDRVSAGHLACFAISLAKDQRKRLHKGMMLLKKPVKPILSFTAEVLVVKGKATTVTLGKTQIMVNILHMRQSAKIMDLDIIQPRKLVASESMLAPGTKVKIEFRFAGHAVSAINCYLLEST
jgi:GTPase